jgi:C-terminal processing protease CtpA/Prc
LIGTDVMRRFAWTFDQKSRRVRIRSESSDPLRLPAVRGSGAILVPALEGYEIVRVLENSPAARVGLRVGDVVVAVDGTRVFERGCDRWNQGDRTETMLSVLRDGQAFDLQVEVVDIVP